MVQAAGSWSMDACCAVPGNGCERHTQYPSLDSCHDRASSSDWLFGLWPGPPQRFEPTGNNSNYQWVNAGDWPVWGGDPSDLDIGWTSGAPGGSNGYCNQGNNYQGTGGEICGGDKNWGATDVEVWYPR